MKSAKGNSRIPAVEVLVSTPLIRDYILHEDKTQSIRDAIAAGTSQYGMQTFDQSLFYLYQSGLINLDEALRGSTNPDEFRLRLAGISNTTTSSREEMEKSSGVGTVSDYILLEGIFHNLGSAKPVSQRDVYARTGISIHKKPAKVDFSMIFGVQVLT